MAPASNPLGALIEEIAAANDWSLRKIARRAGISSSRLYQLVNGEIKAMPDTDTIYGLARALGVPPAMIVERLLDVLHLPRSTVPAADADADAIEMFAVATRAEKDAMLAMLHAMRGQSQRDERQRAEGE